MDGSSAASMPLAGAAKRFIHRFLATGENRFQLLAVELEEERDWLLDMAFLAVATVAMGLIGGIALSAALVILLWPVNPVLTLVILGFVYSMSAMLLCRKLIVLRRRHETLGATLEQLRKDRSCLKKN